MDCREFQLDVFEIATGAASRRRQAAGEAHLVSCPSCRALAADIRSLGATMRASVPEDQSSTELKRRVRTALARSQTTALHSNGRTEAGMASETAGTTAVAPAIAKRRHRLILVPLALAATVMVVMAAWQFAMPEVASGPVVTIVKHEILNEAMRRHVWCSREDHVFHSDADLSSDTSQTESTLTQELGLHVRIPDYVDFGFALVGTRRCRVAGIPVAHALYYSLQRRSMLSFFSMYRIHDLGEQEDDTKVHRYYELGEGPGTTLAWNQGRQTYALSGYLPRPDALAMIESVSEPDRVAFLEAEDATFAKLGSLRAFGQIDSILGCSGACAGNLLEALGNGR